jgi:DNA primase catalytic core
MSSDKLGGRKTLAVAGILEEFEKDEIKARVDIVALFASFGVKLSSKGKGFVGKCPWHEDKEPSLSVDREKGLYHCFGCGESGDAFSLVEKMKGVGFREALVYLKAHVGSSPSNGKKAKPAMTQPAIRAPAASTEEVEQHHIMDDVAERYASALSSHPEARVYLASRGLDRGELIGSFKLGYCAGDLAGALSSSQKTELEGLGILKASGGEHFKGCTVFPLFDETGHVAGFYGRKIAPGSTPAHLYLPGPHRGLFNREAAKVYRDELILAESVIDALSLIVLGIPGVLACYGTNGFTEEHLKLLRDERVKTVAIGFDSDAAGRKASEALAERLMAEGFRVKTVEPSMGKDWNEALVSGLTRAAIQEALSKAPLRANRPAAAVAAGAFEVKRQGPRYVFENPIVRYRLLGVHSAFVYNLRVNIKAEAKGASFLDNVDLYSARSRALFAASAAGVLSLEAPGVEKDLLLIVDHLEAERDRELLQAGHGERRELSEEERKAGMELLEDPRLFDRIVSDLEELGYVGEELNKQLLYIAASSRKMADPISVVILSQSSSGKSLLVETVRRLMPEEDVVAVSSLSDQALNYIGEGGLLHKFLILGEAVHSEVVEHQIREMLSSHELSRLVVTKDVKTGELSSKTVRSPVVVSAVMSTTRAEINPENASRAFLVNADESREQTRRIHESQREKYSLSRHKRERSLIPRIMAAHKAAQRLLLSRLIVNPFASKLCFPDALMRSRRDHERFVDLIASVCFLRQFQKREMETREEGGDEVRYIECDLTDYRVAYRILCATLPSTLSSFPPSAVELYEAVRALLKEKAERLGLKPTEASVSQREIRESTGYNQRWIKRYMQLLAEWEYLIVSGVRGRGGRNSYRLVADESIRMVDLSMIPTPESMERSLGLLRKTV